MLTAVTLYYFIGVAVCDYETTPWPDFVHAKSVKPVNPGAARLTFGSGFLRSAGSLQSPIPGGREEATTKSNQQQTEDHDGKSGYDKLNPSFSYPDETDQNEFIVHDVIPPGPNLQHQNPSSYGSGKDPSDRAGNRVPGFIPVVPGLSNGGGFRTREFERHGDLTSGFDFRKSQVGDHGIHGHPDVMADEIELLNPSDAGTECGVSCEPWQWMCPHSCHCISSEARCDKVPNCKNGEDEFECEGTNEEIVTKIATECEATGMHVMCPKTHRCIAKDWLCDGDDDCGDYSDETHCGARANCTEDQFECQNGFCIQKSWMCDGDNDCKDYSDEMNCTKVACTSEHFQCGNGFCVSLSFRCDGELDCSDGSDEENCLIPMANCPEGEFKCRGGIGGAGGPGGRCVLDRFKCDGDNDCGDWSDEEGCPRKTASCTSSEFKCEDQNCIPSRWKCDGEQDCDGGEDEKMCTAGETTRQEPIVCGPDEYTCRNGRCILKTWLCDGYPDCTKGEDENDCKMSCDPGQMLCPTRKNSTHLKICVQQKHVCDGQNDCPSGEDERNCPKNKTCALSAKCAHLCLVSASGKDECGCKTGFILHENGFDCVDIDECQFLTVPVCSQKCSNTIGSFSCSCEPGYVLRPDLRTCKALGGAVKLLMANRIDIRQVVLSNNRYTSILKGLHNAIAIDYHYKKGLLFWSDVSTDVIKMAFMNGSRVLDVIKWGLESPGGISVDWIHDLIFWTDSGTRRVEVANFQGSIRAVIASSDLDKPRAIVVHPGEAYVFWTDWGTDISTTTGPYPKIERAYMDGSDRKAIISKGVVWPNGLTIDFPSKRIYWADAKHHVIESANFDGSGRTKILSNHLPHPFALTIFEDTMYWTDWNTKSISAANKITGKGFRNVHQGLHFPMDVHSYHPARQPLFTDRCIKDRRGLRGGCSHLCLPNKNSRRCGCPIGLTLKEDLKTCNSVPDKLLLVARRKDIRIRQLNPKLSSTEVDMIVPLDGLKSTVALDWCSKEDLIFWTDVERGTINRAHLNGSRQASVIHTNLVSPAGLALDWATNKLYWTDPGTKRIEVATSDGRLRSLLIWENLDKPRDIEVDPADGFIFWSDWGDKPVIERADMDGKNRVELVQGNLLWPNGLAVDQNNNKLYFVDGGTKTLEYVNFDGSGRTTVVDSGIEHPFGLDVNDQSVFWTDWDTKSVQMADKLTGQNRKAIISNTSELMDIRVFHRSRRVVQNQCSISNGGCSHLCLLNPRGHSCACPIGVQLWADNKTCFDGPSKYVIFAHRYDIRQISLDIDQLVDVVLPLPPITNAMSVDVDLRTGYVYWSDNVEDVIMRATPDGMHVQQVIGDSLGSADGHVIDSVGRKIYWTDAGRHTIEVSELDGSSRHCLHWQDLDSPRGITMDYEAGFLFWTDWGSYPKIEKSAMDGTRRKKIVTAKLGWPNGISADLLPKRLYWTDAQMKHIESCDYDGNDRRLVVSSLKHPYGIAVTNEYVYWTDWKSKALHVLDKANTSSQRIIKSNLDGLMDVKIITRNVTLAENACGAFNGQCSHLCLRNPRGYSCRCPTGITLQEGSLNECHATPKNYIIIALRSGIGQISLDTPELLDTVLPIDGIHGSVVLDFHHNLSKIFYADVNLDVIRSVDMKNLSNMNTLVSSGLSTPNGLAVDWLANNLYWSDTGAKLIEVSRLDGSSRKVILSENLNDPRSLILYPKRGYIFWSDWGDPARIERCLMDGSDRKTIVDEHLGFPTGLAINFQLRRLYWADALQDRIEEVDFEGMKRKVIVPQASHPFGVTIFDSYIYWTDWYNKSVHRTSRSGKSVEEVRNGLRGALDIRSVSERRQPIDWNPCAQDNGGCSHLCFFTTKSYVCGCPDVPDSRPCKLQPAFVVPMRPIPPEYGALDDLEESLPTIITDNVSSDTTSQERIVIVACAIVTVLLIVVVIAILILVLNSLRKKSKRTSRGSSRSVLTYSNPNYNVADGPPMEPKITIWKRLKSDRNQEIPLQDRVYEQRILSAETASSSLIIPRSSPMPSQSVTLPLSTIT